MRDPQSRVPLRTIAATIGMVLLTASILLLGWEVRRVLTWIVVAALLAIILGPLVDITERRLHLRRALATLLVFLVAIVVLAGILTMFVRPLASEGPQFIDRVPSYVEQARTGRGPVGRLVQRYNLDEYLQRNQARLRESANRLTTPALGVLRSIFSTAVRASQRCLGTGQLYQGARGTSPLHAPTIGLPKRISSKRGRCTSRSAASWGRPTASRA